MASCELRVYASGRLSGVSRSTALVRVGEQMGRLSVSTSEHGRQQQGNALCPVCDCFVPFSWVSRWALGGQLGITSVIFYRHSSITAAAYNAGVLASVFVLPEVRCLLDNCMHIHGAALEAPKQSKTGSQRSAKEHWLGCTEGSTSSHETRYLCLQEALKAYWTVSIECQLCCTKVRKYQTALKVFSKDQT